MWWMYDQINWKERKSRYLIKNMNEINVYKEELNKIVM